MSSPEASSPSDFIFEEVNVTYACVVCKKKGTRDLFEDACHVEGKGVCYDCSYDYLSKHGICDERDHYLKEYQCETGCEGAFCRCCGSGERCEACNLYSCADCREHDEKFLYSCEDCEWRACCYCSPGSPDHPCPKCKTGSIVAH